MTRAVSLPTVLRDNNEQLPLAPFVYAFRDGIANRVLLPTRDVSLDTGDYSLPGLERMVVIERKSIADAWGTAFGRGPNNSVGEGTQTWDRFRAEMARASWVARKVIVIEASRGSMLAYARQRHEEQAIGAAVGRCRPPRRSAEENCWALLNMYASLWVDFGVGVEWAGSRAGAEAWVGKTLSRIWDQHTGGQKARDARRRGLGIEELPWLAAEAVPVSSGRPRFATAGGMPLSTTAAQRARESAKASR